MFAINLHNLPLDCFQALVYLTFLFFTINHLSSDNNKIALVWDKMISEYTYILLFSAFIISITHLLYEQIIIVNATAQPFDEMVE